MFISQPEGNNGRISGRLEFTHLEMSVYQRETDEMSSKLISNVFSTCLLRWHGLGVNDLSILEMKLISAGIVDQNV